MLCVYNDLVRAVDSKLVTALVLLDLSSAFDTVDHSTLLTVLDRRFGVQESAMDWFSSYLSDRTQTFCVNAAMSRPIPITCSIPQGSVMGPVLFILYTADVTSIFDSPQVSHHPYADDSQAYVSIPVNNVSLSRQILERISDITSWCTSCRLQLNAAKMELIWFGSRQMLEKLTDANLTLMMKIHISKVKSSQLLLSLASQNSPDLPARLARCHSTAGFIIHFITTRLLQLTVRVISYD